MANEDLGLDELTAVVDSRLESRQEIEVAKHSREKHWEDEHGGPSTRKPLLPKDPFIG